MDEAEQYQLRLQAIVERRRQQEEEKRLRRETEEEWLRTAQKKRKILREHWLSETAPAPVRPSLDISRPRPPLQDGADEHAAALEQTKSQKTPEEDEAADASREEQAPQEENSALVSCADAARTHKHCKPGTDEDVQVNKEDHFVQMAHRMFHESGQDGRSVLGTLAVQVERDSKTGATVIKSVAPVSTPAGAPMTTTVFDDGRKSIHTVGGVEDQPSNEELGQILSVIDGVGMTVLLDEVTVTPNKAELKIENVDASRDPEVEVLSDSTCHAMSEEDNAQLDSSRSYDLESELQVKDCAASMGNEADKKEDKSITVVRDIAGEVCNVGDQSLEESPVTLVFLGYTDSTTDKGHDQEDHEGMVTVERVIITEEGEEHVIGPASSATPQVGEESQEVFQDIHLDGNEAVGVKVQGEDNDKERHDSSVPIIAEGGGTSKRKTCQCCSVM